MKKLLVPYKNFVIDGASEDILNLMLYKLKTIDSKISFHCNKFDLLPPKPKFTGVQKCYRKIFIAPGDKAANNVVVF